MNKALRKEYELILNNPDEHTRLTRMAEENGYPAKYVLLDKAYYNLRKKQEQATSNLMQEICESLGIDKLLNWLNKKLS